MFLPLITVALFPHEVADLEPTFQILEDADPAGREPIMNEGCTLIHRLPVVGNALRAAAVARLDVPGAL